MRIGIITFHWPENYGAVLQCYALQSYLEDQGHTVEVINYQPFHTGLYYLSILIHPQLLGKFSEIRRRKQKKILLDRFRNKYLHLTKRYYTCAQLISANLDYDVIISGSDQILNPSFTLFGERKPTATYYLPFGKSKKIGYAISFGCTVYPTDAAIYAKKWIRNYDVIGTRESTGLNVLNQLQYEGKKQVVPDPTILNYKELFHNIAIPSSLDSYYCVYTIRHPFHLEADNEVKYIDDNHSPISLENWLGLIVHSKGLITNSYHGMIMAIIAHVPFVALVETASGKGMNDRFTTLLIHLGIDDRILPFDSENSSVMELMELPIRWDEVDKKMEMLSAVGTNFLKDYCHV